MESRPQVSTIIPVYNGELYLAHAIESVLAQDYQPIEVIVVDDGSTDGSSRIAESFGSSIRYYFQPNRGTAAAFNLGIDQAHGDYFAFLGADDLWTDGKIRRQVAAFATHPNADIISGHVKQFFSPELDEKVKKKIRFSTDLIPGQVIPAMLVKRTAFFRVGLFETQWQVGAEMSWYLRAMETGLRVVMLPDLVLLRRIHGSNKGITKRGFITQRAQILKASLDRQRMMKLGGFGTTSNTTEKDQK